MNSIVSVSDFKAHCLEYIENTSNENFEYILTKRNRPVAKLVPLKNEIFQFGQFKGTAMIKGNIMDSIDSDIALESVQLPNFEHKDPSDRFIIATARVLNCELMTHDQKLVAYSKQGHVNIK